MNRNFIIVVLVLIVGIAMLWSFRNSQPTDMQEAAELPQQQFEHLSMEQVSAIASYIACPAADDKKLNLTDCPCDSAKFVEKQITALLMAGLPPEKAVEHLFMMGFSAVDGGGQSALPEGHPPIESE